MLILQPQLHSCLRWLQAELEALHTIQKVDQHLRSNCRPAEQHEDVTL